MPMPILRWLITTSRSVITPLRKTYEQLVSSHSNNPDVLNNYGTFLCRNSNYSEADEMFRRAVVQPRYLRMDDSYENAGICARQAGQKEKALEYYRLALGYNPNKVKINAGTGGNGIRCT